MRLDDAPRKNPYVRSWYDLGLRVESYEKAAVVEVAPTTPTEPTEWPMLGGTNKAYKVKSGTREAWTPPEGWTKPTKPVQSWYDKGDRLDAAPRANPYVRSWYDLGLTL